MTNDEIRVLRFLTDLPEHVQNSKPQAFPFRAPLSHQTLNYAIAERFHGMKWREVLTKLHGLGYVIDPNKFRAVRVFSNGEVADVVTQAGRKTLN